VCVCTRARSPTRQH